MFVCTMKNEIICIMMKLVTIEKMVPRIEMIQKKLL
jgi:hypothetical protein